MVEDSKHEMNSSFLRPPSNAIVDRKKRIKSEYAKFNNGGRSTTPQKLLPKNDTSYNQNDAR